MTIMHKHLFELSHTKEVCFVDRLEKLRILTDAAKYDVACTSSGASRTARAGTLGSCYAPGCCHAFTADGLYKIF